MQIWCESPPVMKVTGTNEGNFNKNPNRYFGEVSQCFGDSKRLTPYSDERCVSNSVFVEDKELNSGANLGFLYHGCTTERKKFIKWELIPSPQNLLCFLTIQRRI